MFFLGILTANISFLASGGSRISQTAAAPTPGRGHQPIIWPIFPKNYVEMEKFWARGEGRVPRVPIDPPLLEELFTALLFK